MCNSVILCVTQCKFLCFSYTERHREARRVTEISFIVELLLAYFHKEPAWIGEEGVIC